VTRSEFRMGVFMALATLSPQLSAHKPSGSSGAPAMSLTARSAAAVVDAFHAALKRSDGLAATALLADDVLILEAGGVERSKAEYASQHLPADMAFSQAVPLTLTHRTGHATGSTAWIASEGRVTGTYQGRKIDRITAETMILRRIGGTWKIVHIHWSSAAKK
jgi:Calcium/calmodulin dependent protein kinase II Association.